MTLYMVTARTGISFDKENLIKFTPSFFDHWRHHGKHILNSKLFSSVQKLMFCLLVHAATACRLVVRHLDQE